MKKYIGGLLAIAIAIGAAAFTVAKTPADAKATFYYWRSGTGNQYAAGSYTSVSSATYSGIACAAGNFVCKFSSSVSMPAAGLLDTNGDNVPDALNNAEHTPITPLRKGS